MEATGAPGYDDNTVHYGAQNSGSERIVRAIKSGTLLLIEFGLFVALLMQAFIPVRRLVP
jgi:hypothetical protein